MKLYNTLSRKVEEFKPQNSKQVRMYSCGPTVYDHIHVGNLSSFIAADTLRRTLNANGYTVDHAMNFTDVDDKTIRRSQEQYPDAEPTEALGELTKHYSEIFLNDMQAIGNDISAVSFVKATESIDQMQTLIRSLYKEGFAYLADDGIYFSIDKYRASGKKYGQLTEITASNTGQARIQNDEYDKESAHDFALWKLQKGSEPAWEFELDGHDLLGRPGWHIECSAMSREALGQPFDIHTGGVDLIFPHHENEIAQSTAGNDDPIYAKYFVHNEHLLVEGHKMSKSLNNFFTLRDIIEKGYEPLAFRLMILQSHYRSQSNFTWENLDAAQNRLKDLYAWADLRHQPRAEVMPQELDELFRDTRKAIQAAIANDLNTPVALAKLNRLVAHMQNIPIPGVDGKYTDGTLKFIDSLLGLNLDGRPDISKDQKRLVQDREEARQAKNWAKSDELRATLEEQQLGVRDTNYGPQWYRL